MPPLKDVTTMVTAARSRLIRFNFIIQNYAQLNQVYGKEDAETIKGNCNTMYLISSELQALEEISKMCGEVKSKEKDKTASTPLVTVSDLQRLSKFEVISLRLRSMPFKTKLTPNYKMDWGKKYERATYPHREKEEVKLFDLKEFVKNLKKEKMNEMMSGMGMPNGNNPFSANPFGANPFGGSSPMVNPFAIGQMPMSNQTTSLNSSDDMKEESTFNVEDLVKKIDAKIAELEEEERKEQQEKKQNNNMVDPNLNDLINNNEPIKEAIIEEKPEVPKKEENKVSDDAFFDDFFSDD